MTRWLDLISAGDQLCSGYLDIKEVFEIKGLQESQKYLIDEIQLVYESQGIPINDKHFEVIVRKMSDKVKILDPGDTSLLTGETVDKRRFEEIKDFGNRVQRSVVFVLWSDCLGQAHCH